jgi:hypothetical protein
MSAGKGDKPRNCFSKNYKNNYDNIIWEKKNKPDVKVKEIKGKKIYVYKQN